MPTYDAIPEIVDRGLANPKLGGRKFRRFPSGRPGYIGKKRDPDVRKRVIKTYGAKIEPNEVGDPLSIYVELRNGTGHPMTFWVSGTCPDVYVELEGNTTYSPPMVSMGGVVAVRLDGPDGELLATMNTEEDNG